MDSIIGFEMSFFVVEAIRGQCASFIILTATSECRQTPDGVFIDRLRKTFAGTKSDLVIGLMSTSAYLATPPA